MATDANIQKMQYGIIFALVLVIIYLLVKPADVGGMSPGPKTPVPKTSEAGTETKAVIEGWGQIPLSEETKNWLADNKIRQIALLNDTLQLRIADGGGKEKEICARPVGETGIGGPCTAQKAHTIKYITDLSFMVTESSPGCQQGRRGGYKWDC